MAKAKDKLVPQKKSQTKPEAPKQAPPKASWKSQQYVVDSDDEDAPPEDKKVKKVLSQPAPISEPASASRQSNGAADATENEPEGDESEGEKEDSDEEQADDLGGVEKSIPPSVPRKVPEKTNGVKRTSTKASSSSEEESEEESGEELAPEPAAKRQKTTAAGTARRKSSADTDTRVEDRSPPQAPPSKKEAAVEEGTVSGPIPAKSYHPPLGYVPIDLSAMAQSDQYAPSSVEGKQIWHITAPSHVSLASIKEVALDTIRLGKPVLSHKGTDYVLSEAEAGSGSAVVFAPGKESYTPVEQRVERTLQLQQQVTLSKLGNKQASQITGSTAAAEIAQAAVSNIRPQPKGLRMRYRPPAYGDGDPGTIGSDSDSIFEDTTRHAKSSFQFPRVLGAHGTSEQHAKEATAAHVIEGSAKKSNKKRKGKQRDSIAESPMVNGRANEVNAAVRASHQDGATASVAATSVKKAVAPEIVDGDVTMTDAATAPKLSKEDKAQRKEEKRLKKEAKLKAKQV